MLSDMDTINLIVRGQEFGLCHAANQATCEGFEAGVLTCASLLVAGPWLAEAVALAHAHREWEIGLQLTLTCPTAGCRWGPVAPATLVPSLVEPTATFPRRLATDANAAEIARELEAQVERARAWGITPAYLDFMGEAGPEVDAAVQHLGGRLGIPTGTTCWGIASMIQRAPGSAFQPCEQLRDLRPGTHLWEVRPAQASPETWGLWPDEEQARARQADALAICDPELIALVRSKSIELLSFRQHIETRLGAEAESE
jgi:hypothetical protein